MAELSNLCRLCAVKVDDYIGIYEEEGHKLSLEVKITKYLQIEVKPRDSLPKAVCLDCCTKLDQCSHFHESSLQAQLTLQMIFLPKLDHVVQQHLTSIGKVEDVLQQTQPVEFNHFDHDTSSMLGEEFQEPNLDPTPPVYVECVLSDNHNNANSLKDGAGLSSLVAPSKRKCRTPVRCAQDTLDAKKEPADQVRVEEVEDEEDEEYLEEEEPLSSRKRRDGWDKFPWRCTDCPQELPSMQALRSHHQEVHKQTVRFLCIQCKKVYTKYYGFVSHVRRHKNHMKFCCEECGKCFSNKKVLESHRATHSDARPYVCSECGKAFRQQSALYVHNRSHQPDEVKNKYPCDQCDKKFSTKPNLVTHKRIHTGIRNYTCDQCGKSFIQKGNLDAHLLTHSSDKPHTCTICNKGFKTPLQLRKHQTVHTGAKPHQCDVCGRQFRERGTLREHHRIHTGAMPFTCEFCGKAFRFKGILTTHRRQHTGERPYSCLECQHHFTNWPNYNKHMKRRHGINTSHQPDPNKLALANMANLQQQQQQQHPQQHHHNSVATTPDHLGPDLSLYEDDRERGPASSTHFYAAAAGLPSVGAYMGAPLNASSMLGFYNIPQLQGLDPSAMDMLHPLQHR